ncbi:MAG: hypothetical protein ABI602_04785 [Candidatus Saccharibacteria bacterium]
MIGGNKPHGYTIVEVLIFLAISSLMFLMAAAFISGKQSAVEFKQSNNDINTQIRSIVNDVSNGQYPSAAGFSCSAPLIGPPVIAALVAKQGSNVGCIFMGKVVQFNVAGDPSAYNVYTIAARQTGSTGSSVTTFAEAQPIAVDSAVVNLTDKKILQNGMEVTKVLQCKADCIGVTNSRVIGSFGFFGSLGNYGLSQSSTPESGAQTLVTASIPSSVYGVSEPIAVTSINLNAKNIISTNNILTNNIMGNGNYILLCFKNGSKKSSVSIGGQNGQQFTTTLETGNGLAAAC